MLKIIIYLIIVFLFVFSFVAPATLSLWKEFHQSAAAISACFLLYFFSKKKEIYSVNHFTLPIFYLIFLIILFLILKKPVYIAPSVVGVIYLSCVLLMHNVAFQFGVEKSINAVSLVLIVVGVISIFIQTLQLFGLTGYFYPWVYQMQPSPGMRPYANIGQPNILASIYLTLSVLWVWLYQKRKINKYLFFCFFIFIAYGIALTQSRTAYLAIIILSFLFIFHKDEGVSIKYIYPLMLVCILAIAKLIESHYGVSREITENLNNGRFDIWLMGMEAINKSPWLGYGFHETARATISVIETSGFKYSLTAQIHNLFLDFIIWFGLPAGGLLVGLVIRAVYKALRNAFVIKNMLPVATLAPFFIHSLLEYPLYYANNLMVFGFLLGLNALFFVGDKDKYESAS